MASIRPPVTRQDGRKAYEVRWKDPAGKWRSQTEHSLKDARAVKALVESEMVRGKYIDRRAGEKTFKDVAQEWLSTLGNESTRLSTEQRLRLHVYPVIGDRQIASITVTDIANTINSWRSLAPSTRGAVFTAMNSVFLRAVEDKRIPDNPCASKTVRRPKRGDTETPDAWPQEWVEGVCRGIRHDYAIFPLIASGCGLRQGEIFGLSPDDFDWEANTVAVRRQVKVLPGNVLRFAPPKHRLEVDRPRVVPVPGFVKAAVLAHLEEYGSRPVRLPWDPNDNSNPGPERTYDLLLVTREGKATNKNYFNGSLWKPTLVTAGVIEKPEPGQRYAPSREHGTHALRHYYACRVLESGAGLKRLAELLGHRDTSASFTLRVYARLDRSREVDVASALDAMFTGGAPDVG